MRVSFIGCGNVATVLAKLMNSKGLLIHEIYGRNITNANALAKLVNANAVDDIQSLSKHVDVYIIAVSDKALVEIAPQLNFESKLVLHTAGSVSIDIIKNTSENFGVLYPVQSLRKVMDITTPIPFLIDGNNENSLTQIKKIAQLISRKIVQGNDEARVKLHVACVFACNFTNYMYLQSAAFCKAENLDFSLLQSLIEETANRLQTHHPAEVFTGPAVRGDVATIEKHLALLQNYPALHGLYHMLSRNILNEFTTIQLPHS